MKTAHLEDIQSEFQGLSVVFKMIVEDSNLMNILFVINFSCQEYSKKRSKSKITRKRS